MTWVAAMVSEEFPEAACVSDIQITFKKGNKKSTHNGLRKVYRITYSLALAFSGSVALGFKVLDDLREQKAHLYDDPKALMTAWPKSVAALFRSAQQEGAPSLGLLVLGLDHNHSKSPMPFIYKLESPQFIPHKAQGTELLSIGCGAQHYAEVIRNTCRQPNSFKAYEYQEFRGRGIGIGLMALMSMEWRNQPAEGVSEELLCTIVSPHDSVDFPYRATIGNTNIDAVRHVGMPQLATSWDQVRQLAKSIGLTAAGASC